MSHATTTSPTLDLTDTPAIPFTRLVSVELRKMADTRSGRALLAAIVVITLAILIIFTFAADTKDHTFENYTGITATPQGFLLPVLGILLVTSEWGQRTTLTTFTLSPRRGSVIWAKVAAAVLFGLAAIVVALVLASLATVVAGSDNAWAGVGADDIGKFGLLQVSGILQGLAFGMLLLNSAAAIVSYFVLPIAFTIVANLWSALRDIAPWVDISTAQQVLFGGNDVTGKQWLQLLVASTIWIIVPLVIGLVRVQRAEVK